MSDPGRGIVPWIAQRVHRENVAISMRNFYDAALEWKAHVITD